MVIGVGSGADDNELRSIAMENSDNVMKLGSFDHLAENVKNLTRGLCQGKDVFQGAITEHVSRTYYNIYIYVYIYVIYRPGGPYREKLCPYSRPRAQFFPIRTDLGR